MDDLETTVRQVMDATRPEKIRHHAFSTLVARFQDMAYGYAVGRLGDTHLAEDVTQEAFVAAWQNMGRLRQATAFPGWFRRIVQWRCHRFERSWHIKHASYETLVHTRSDHTDILSDLERKDVDRRIRSTIQDLSEGVRVVVVLHYLEDYTQKEIAQFLEIGEGAVRKRLHDARRKLKEPLLNALGDTLRRVAPSGDTRIGGRIMQWIKPEFIGDDYDGFMKGRGTQVWDMLLASAEGDLQRVRTLLEEDAGLANCEFAYTTPLLFAVREGHIEVVRCLLDAGADPTYESPLDYVGSPLIKAQDRGYDRIAEIIEEAIRRVRRVLPDSPEIYEAVRRGDADRVQALLASQPDLVHATRMDSANTPLHEAVSAGNANMIRILLDHGADVNAEGEGGFKPIYIPLNRRYNNNPDIQDGMLVGLLLERGADNDIAIAAAVGDLETVRRFITEDANTANTPNSAGYRPLRYAARYGHATVVDALLDGGADPSAPEPNAPGGSALWLAATGYDHPIRGGAFLRIAERLMQAGADPMAGIESSGNAFGWALQMDNQPLLALMYQYGAAPDFAYYLSQGQMDVVSAMLKLDPDLVKKYAIGDYNPLHGIAAGVDTEKTGFLIKHGLDLNKPYYANNYFGWWLANAYGKDPEGMTPTVRYLFENGADPNLATWLGVTYMHLFVTKTSLSVEARKSLIGLLLEYGADINALDDEWLATPLGWAARWGETEMATFLIERGADPNGGGSERARPLAWAEQKGHNAIVAMLES